MSIHELPRMGRESEMAGYPGPAVTDRDVTARWRVQRSEVILPPPASVASFVAIGLFAGALVGGGITLALIHQLVGRWWRGK